MIDRLQPVAVAHEGLHVALEQADHALRGLTGLEEHGARRQDLQPGGRGPGGESVVGQVVEEVDRAQVGRAEGRLAHASARYSWMSDTAIEPSPTALATRLIERARTSPATSTPGTLVSSG